MSVFSSTLSLSSNAQTNQLDEKAKLLSLVRAWRSKYDQVHTASLRHRDVIDSLKKDVDRLNEEKESVSSHLQLTIDKERAENKSKLTEIKAKLTTIENEKELETKTLKEKIKKLQNDVKPIINVFKERDIKWQEKMEKTEEVVKDLKEKLKEKDELLENSTTKNQKQKNEITTENENLKKKYQENMEEIKNHCTLRIIQLRKNLEEKFKNETKIIQENCNQILQADKKLKNEEIEKLNKIIIDKEEEKKKIEENFKKEKKQIEESVEEKVKTKVKQKEKEFDKVKKEITEDSKNKIIEIEKTNDKEILRLKLEYNTEIRKFKKKVELINMKFRDSQKENKRLRDLFEEGKSKLQKTRKLTKRQHSDVSVVVLKSKDLAPASCEHDDATSSPPMTSPPPNLTHLLEELGLRMREMSDIEKALDRHDNLGKDTEVEEDEQALRLEIQYYIKINEISHLKKNIRQEQINYAYRDTSNLTSSNVTSSNVSEKTFVSNNNRVTYPGFTVLATNVKSNTSSDLKKEKLFVNKKKRLTKRRSVPSGRNEWLKKQHDSTVQLNPKLNGKDIWY